MKVCKVTEMQAMDAAAITEFGIPEELLMENAGLAAATVINREFGIAGKSFTVFCGLGNNGGDGFVIARKIHSLGGQVSVFSFGGEARYKGVARLNYDILRRLGFEIHTISDQVAWEEELANCDVIVDAIFGTGITRPLGGLYLAVINAINNSNKPVFSVDIPSGINGNNGQVMGAAVKADHTITFGLPKTGNLLYPGYNNCGQLFVSHISFPPQLRDNENLKVAVGELPTLPARNPAGHKGSFGNVLFIAGAANYYGAPYFAASSFLKAGGGYSRLAAPKSIIPNIAERSNEIVFHPQPETKTGSLALENGPSLLKLGNGMDMVVIGPGLSLENSTQELIRLLVRDLVVPVIIDGDGLTAISSDATIVTDRQQPTILTPHPGEMSRLINKSVAEIQDNPFGLLQETCQRLQATIVLKGAHSLIGLADQQVYINLSGNSGMGSAGSGDVLTGTIAAMFGLGLATADATRVGVFIHGLAGDLAAREIGEDGITAQDVLDYLPVAVSTYRAGLPDYLLNKYNLQTVV
ncbi:MAG: NAD(P)H-hydrate dehydratase [Candidatus Marinimicrobia bacterium]|nr:NAD(P)H-hydrate dehydratase [Candidatus Neomarinimicrobiota bacterium]